MKTAWIIWKKYMRKMSGGEYLSFMLPGIMALTALGGAIGGGFTWLSERSTGLVREYWVAPVPRLGILMGNSVASVSKSMLQTLVIVGIGLLAGAAFSTSVLGVLGAVILVAGFGLGFGGIALSIASGTVNEGAYHSMIMLLNLPLLFLSSALYALKTLPKWMQVAARINPTSYLVDGVRQLMMGSSGDFPLWLCFTVVLGFGCLFMVLSIGAFKKSHQ